MSVEVEEVVREHVELDAPPPACQWGDEDIPTAECDRPATVRATHHCPITPWVSTFCDVHRRAIERFLDDFALAHEGRTPRCDEHRVRLTPPGITWRNL